MRILENPKTELYLDLKGYILSSEFPWYWCSESTYGNHKKHLYKNVPFYSHTFIARPEHSKIKIPKISSPVAEKVCGVLVQILNHNNVGINSFLRINANCLHPQNGEFKTVPHFDHEYNHKNMIVYLTQSGGSIVVNVGSDKEELFEPKEDDVIFFGGVSHYVITPKEERRIALVATFF